MYEETTGRTLLQKILLILLAAMAVLFAVLTVVFRSQPRVEWADSLLRPAQTENTAVFSYHLWHAAKLLRNYIP